MPINLEDHCSIRGRGDKGAKPAKFLWGCRTTPNPSKPDGTTPSEILMSRKFKDNRGAALPNLPEHLSIPKGGLAEGPLVYDRDFRPDHPGWTGRHSTRKWIPVV